MRCAGRGVGGAKPTLFGSEPSLHGIPDGILGHKKTPVRERVRGFYCPDDQVIIWDFIGRFPDHLRLLRAQKKRPQGALLTKMSTLPEKYPNWVNIATNQVLSSARIEAEMIAPPHRRSPMQIGTGFPLATVFLALPKAYEGKLSGEALCFRPEA